MEKKTNNQALDLTAFNDIAQTLTQVTKFTGTAVVLLSGAMILLKVSKIMLKDIKGLGL
jgi:hypothetical protein